MHFDHRKTNLKLLGRPCLQEVDPTKENPKLVIMGTKGQIWRYSDTQLACMFAHKNGDESWGVYPNKQLDRLCTRIKAPLRASEQWQIYIETASFVCGRNHSGTKK